MKLSRALRVQRKEVVTLVGGGGKTALMFALADELSADGWRVVTTMTTRIFVGQMSRAPARLLLHGEGALLATLPELLSEHGYVLVGGGTVIEQDKVQGVPPEVVDRIAAHPAVNAVIAEADGSRRQPFKAPADHEPIVPAATTLLVPMVGLDVVSQPLTSEHVHRPERIAALTGAAPGAAITPEMIAQVLAHPEGGAKGLPNGGRLVPFLNKADNELQLADGRVIAHSLLATPRVDSVVIGAIESSRRTREVWSRVGAVILAAGGASRYGSLKQVMPWRGIPLVTHVVEQALNCPDVAQVVVTMGAGVDAVRAAVAGCRVSRMEVPDWAAGQSRSVQAGLAALRAADPALGAALFLLADQPGITPELLAALVQRHRETLAPVVAPRYQGRRGNPVLFDRATFDAFAGLSGDVGARPIIERYAGEVAWVDWPTPEVIQDIDTPEDMPES
jgi:molybdenum cofactor cytidylyltransferase